MGWLKKYQKGGQVNSIVDYLASKGEDFSKEARSNLAKQYNVENYDFSAAKNIELLNKIKSSPNPSAFSTSQAPMQYVDWNTIKTKQAHINNLPDEEKIKSYHFDKPDEQYIVVDKKKSQMNLYQGDKLLKTFEVGTGKNKGDAQTVTNVSDGKVNWSKGNWNTGAGIYTIDQIDPANKHYSNLPSFSLKNEKGIQVSNAIHATLPERLQYFGNDNLEDNRMSNGCINGKCEDVRDLYHKYKVKPGTKVFVLPEENDNRFLLQDNKLIFKSSAKNRAKYKSYIDSEGTVQKGQGINTSENTLNYSPIRILTDKSKFQKDVYQWNDFNDENEYQQTTKPFVQALVDNKKAIMQAASIPSDVYNDIAKISFGIYGTESNFGDTHSAIGNFLRAGKKFINPSGSSSPDYQSKYTTYGANENSRSTGLTQLRWNQLNEHERNVLSKLGITSNKDFLDPKKAAVATAAVLGVRYNEQLNDEQKKDIFKNLPKRWNSRENYSDRVLNNSKYINIQQYTDKKYQYGGGSKQPSNLWDTDKTAWIDSALSANVPNRKWVEQMYNPQAKNIEIDGKNYQQFLEYGEGDNGIQYVYPTIDFDAKGTPTYYGNNAAYHAAQKRIAIPFQTPEKAKYFINNAEDYSRNLFPYGIAKERFPDSYKENGGMIKRADGSYSQRGLWDNIRANAGSGKKPTKEMLKQEKKIRAAEKEHGGKISMEGYKRNSPDKDEPMLTIPSNRITMQGVDFPVMAYPSAGNPVLMQPGGEYMFPGAKHVTEVPAMQGGGAVPTIDDAGSFKNGIWTPDLDTIKKEAKRLGSRIVKTKSGSIIKFDKNWNIQGVDDNPVMQDGGPKPSNVATTQDSLDVYNNAKALLNYYRSRNYSEKSNPFLGLFNVFDLLDNANIKYKNDSNRARIYVSQKGIAKKGPIPYSIYHQDIDSNKFKQRENANFVLDTRAPMALYDRRITPTVLYSFENKDKKDPLHGDAVSIFGFDPVMIKPYSLLTPEEKEIRNQKSSSHIEQKPSSHNAKALTYNQQALAKANFWAKKLQEENIDRLLLSKQSEQYHPQIVNLPTFIPKINEEDWYPNKALVDIDKPEDYYKLYNEDGTRKYIQEIKTGGWLNQYQRGGGVPPFITSDIDEYNYRKARQLDSNYLNKNLRSYFNKNAEKFYREHTIPWNPYASKLNPFGPKTYSREEAEKRSDVYWEAANKNKHELLENISRNLQIRKINDHRDIYNYIYNYSDNTEPNYNPQINLNRENQRVTAHFSIPQKIKGKWYSAYTAVPYEITKDFPAATQEVIFDPKAPKSTGNKKAVSKPVPRAPLERVSVSQVPVADMQQFPILQSAQQYANYAQVPVSPYSVNVHRWDPMLSGRADEVKNFLTQEQLEDWKKANRVHALGTGRYETGIAPQYTTDGAISFTPQMKGGGIPPIYVDSPSDPRYRAYQDSLRLYNKGVKDDFFYSTYEWDPQKVHEFPPSLATSYAMEPDNKIKPIIARNRINDPNHPAYYRAQWFKYKKPVEQVILGQQINRLPIGSKSETYSPMSVPVGPYLPKVQGEWYGNKVNVPIDAEDVSALYNEDGTPKYTQEMKEGGIPQRYKNMGFTHVGQKKAGDGQHKWKVLAKKGDSYKVVQGGYRGMQDFKQHHSQERRDRFWDRMGGRDSAKAKDPFSPLYWHKRFGTWEYGGPVEMQGGGVPPVFTELMNWPQVPIHVPFANTRYQGEYQGQPTGRIVPTNIQPVSGQSFIPSYQDMDPAMLEAYKKMQQLSTPEGRNEYNRKKQEKQREDLIRQLRKNEIQNQDGIRESSYISPAYREQLEREYNWKQAKQNVVKPLLKGADVVTDVMQVGNFIPHPIAQGIGKVGNILGTGVDALQAGMDLGDGNYGSAAINAGSMFIPLYLGSKGYRRDMYNTEPGSIADMIASKGTRDGNYIHLTQLSRLRNNPVTQKGVNFNRGILGALAAETAIDTKEQGGMIRRADGSYSQRGLWDNIRANAGSGKKPTKEMLEQERKIKAAEKKEYGGWLNKYQDGGGAKMSPSQIAAIRQASANFQQVPYQDMDPAMLQGYQVMQELSTPEGRAEYNKRKQEKEQADVINQLRKNENQPVMRGASYVSPAYSQELKRQYEVNQIIKPVLHGAEGVAGAMQLASFIPHPAAQVIGGIGDAVGTGLFALETGMDLGEGKYKDAAIGAGLTAAPTVIGEGIKAASPYINKGINTVSKTIIPTITGNQKINLQDLQAAKKFAKKYGYKLPSDLKRIAESDVLTDRTIRGMINRHNTFARGVSTNWEEIAKKNPEIIKSLEQKGFNLSTEEGSKAAAEYMSTTIPSQTGYGRYGLKSGEDALYLSNSIPTAEGYTYGKGYIAKVKRPTDFSSPNRQEWIKLNDFDAHLGFKNSPFGTGVVKNDYIKRFPTSIRDVLAGTGDPTKMQNVLNKALEKKELYDELARTAQIKNQNKIATLRYNTDANYRRNLLGETDPFIRDNPNFLDKANLTYLEGKNYLTQKYYDLLPYMDVAKSILSDKDIYKSVGKNLFSELDPFSHYAIKGNPEDKILDLVKLQKVTPEVWENTSRQHINKYSDKLSRKKYGGWLNQYQTGGAIKNALKPQYKNAIDKYNNSPLSTEQKVNKLLGDPQSKARKDAKNKSGDGDEEIDNIRHASAGRYTAEAIANKTGNIPYFSKPLGMVGANVLGLGHELATYVTDPRWKDPKWKVSPMEKAKVITRELFEDSYNNFIGSAVGTSNLSPKEKTERIKNLSRNYQIPDGYGLVNPYEDNPTFIDPYEIKGKSFSKKYGGWLAKYK